jgi:hypothetical protein
VATLSALQRKIRFIGAGCSYSVFLTSDYENWHDACITNVNTLKGNSRDEFNHYQLFQPTGPDHLLIRSGL